MEAKVKLWSGHSSKTTLILKPKKIHDQFTVPNPEELPTLFAGLVWVISEELVRLLVRNVLKGRYFWQTATKVTAGSKICTNSTKDKTCKTCRNYDRTNDRMPTLTPTPAIGTTTAEIPTAKTKQQYQQYKQQRKAAKLTPTKTNHYQLPSKVIRVRKTKNQAKKNSNYVPVNRPQIRHSATCYKESVRPRKMRFHKISFNFQERSCRTPYCLFSGIYGMEKKDVIPFLKFWGTRHSYPR